MPFSRFELIFECANVDLVTFWRKWNQLIIFLQVFFDKMREAQQEIKSTVSVNTSDIAAKAYEDKDLTKEIERIAQRKSKFI